MKINYLISITLLLISFLLIKKTDKKISIIKSIIYTLCLFYCYQTVIVYLVSYLNIGGSLLTYSMINYLISLILFFFLIQKKKIQIYQLSKKELLITSLIAITVLVVVLYRFRCFNTLSYISDDPATHYLASKTFKDTLAILTEKNHQDFIFNFNRMMPMFYINCGFFIKIFSNIPSYKAFMIHDAICLIMYALLFFITIDQNKKSNSLYTYVATILYTVAYPLSNLIFGFSYLGLGIMTINLLIYTISFIKDNLTENKTLKIIILFIINFSLFNSYYLFMPFIYLSLEIYYILLWKKKKITIKDVIHYSIFTTIIPFLIGFIHFILPGFFNMKTNIITAIAQDGDIYKNIAPIYLFIFTSAYLVYDKIKNKTKSNFFQLTFYLLSIYILIFLVLYILKISATYYFYKLFYIYWLFFSIYIINVLIKKKKILYIFLMIVLISSIYTIKNPYNNISYTLEKTNIYNYNIAKFNNNWIRLNKDELELIDKAVEYKRLCEKEHKFPIIGRGTKNAWFYAITKSVPNIHYKRKSSEELYVPNISLEEWKETNYKCVLYFKENNVINNDKEYKVLYQNKGGLLLSRK